MKLFVATLALFVLVVCSASALPVQSEMERLEHVDSGLMVDAEKPVTRNKRFSCDVFSFESGVVTPNNSVCATKCIFMNRRGGHCENMECICREDKVIESLP